MRAWVLVALAWVGCKSTTDDDQDGPKKKTAAPKPVASASPSASASASSAPSEAVVVKTDARVVVTKEKTTGPLLLSMDGTTVPLRSNRDEKGKLGSVWAAPGGRFALAIFSEGGKDAMYVAKLSGEELDLADLLTPAATDSYVVGASEDGRTALIDRQAKDESQIILVRVGKPPVALWKGRAPGGGAVSADGKRAAFAGVPSSCAPPKWLGHCPYHTFRVDLDAVPPKVTPVLEPKVGATYQPRFHPTDPATLYYQSTLASAEGCTDLNHCRHDLMVRAFADDGAAPRLVRKDAYGLAIAGKLWFFQSLEGAGCGSLPCTAAALFVGSESDIGTAPRSIATDIAVFNVRYVSPDETLLAYRGSEGGPSGATGIVIRTIAGKKLRFLEGHHPHGWLR